MLTNPGNQIRHVGHTRRACSSLRRDPNGDELGYGASGLPPGLTLDATTGLISGTPSATGNYNVVVAASDGINTASAVFLWTIADPAPLQVSAAAAAGGAAVRRAGKLHGQHRERSERAAALGLR